MDRQTVFSPCREYRYVLWREWDALNPDYAMFIGLNPSTADEVNDDPTIRRCVDFARRWGHGALCMTNLFAYRATQPTRMKAHPTPIGVANDRWLKRLARHARVVVAGWGVHGSFMGREQAVRRLLTCKLSYLALTKGGHPHHPLYLKHTMVPRLWE